MRSETAYLVSLIVPALLVAATVYWALWRVSRVRASAKQQVERATEEADEAQRLLGAFRNRVERVVVGYQPQRYQIKIADWGPDFTGEDGTLPRFRWVVVDADHDLKRALGAAGDEPEVFMLGNAPTPLEAYTEAARWIEKTETSAVIVEGNFQ